MNLLAPVSLPYRLLVLAFFVVALVGIGWVKGTGHVQAEWDAENTKQALHVSAVKQRQAEVTVQVITQYVDRVKIVRKTGGTIIKEVPVYVSPEADAACVLHRGFVRLHDAAAAGRIPEPAGGSAAAPAGIALSTVIGTVVDNYGRCRENAEQLIALQAWISEIHAKSSETKD